MKYYVNVGLVESFTCKCNPQAVEMKGSSGAPQYDLFQLSELADSSRNIGLYRQTALLISWDNS